MHEGKASGWLLEPNKVRFSTHSLICHLQAANSPKDLSLYVMHRHKQASMKANRDLEFDLCIETRKR